MNSFFKCRKCGWSDTTDKYYFKCPRCGSPLDIEYRGKGYLDRKSLKGEGTGIFKYKDLLPPVDKTMTLSEGETPIVYDGNLKTYFICEHLNPSGSFKDRGAALTISYISSLDINKELVEDSSGNAGIALTLYSMLAGLKIHIFTPKDAPEGKIRLIKLLGGILHQSISRDEAYREAYKYSKDRIYVGHLYNPYFLYGVKTISYHISEIINYIDNIFIPFGSGTLYLGIYYGIKELYDNDIIKSKPVLHVVEAEGYEKIANALGLKRSDKKSKYMDGIKVSIAPRIDEVLESFKEFKVIIHSVTDFDTAKALRKLIKLGYIVEPTSAASLAALSKSIEEGSIRRTDKNVIILTGSGLKMLDRLGEIISLPDKI